MKFLASFLNGLHNTIGISTPPPDKVALAGAIWLGSILFILLVLFILVQYVI